MGPLAHYMADDFFIPNPTLALSPELSRFKSTNNKSQLYHTDFHIQVLIAFNDIVQGRPQDLGGGSRIFFSDM